MRPCGQAEVADSAASNNAQGALVACHLWLPHLVTYGCSLFYIRLQVATELLRYSTVAGPAGTLAAPAAEVAAAYLPDSLLAPLLLTILLHAYSYLLYSYSLYYLLCPGGGGAARAQLLGGEDAGQHAH